MTLSFSWANFSILLLAVYWRSEGAKCLYSLRPVLKVWCSASINGLNGFLGLDCCCESTSCFISPVTWRSVFTSWAAASVCWVKSIEAAFTSAAEWRLPEIPIYNRFMNSCKLPICFSVSETWLSRSSKYHILRSISRSGAYLILSCFWGANARITILCASIILSGDAGWRSSSSSSAKMFY